MYWRSLSLPTLPLLFLLLTPVPLLAQPIIPAADGTGTEVLQEGDRYTITGGTRARENLFHSFQRLGLDANEIATFLAQPGIENILGRVVGGDASLIDGLLQVQGSGVNLYLMNPAGIVFGPNAQLDVSGSFYATSATGIGLGDNWFNALGNNTYADLIGTPDSFAFTLANGGVVANLANLSVDPGQSLSLIGGTVVNTGTLSAPGGTVTLAAVPGENRVRLSQTGNLLSLELEAANGTWDAALNPANLTPLSLPQLLMGGTLANASQMTVNPDGTIRLQGANVSAQDGTTLVAGTLNASGTAGAEINVLGDRVALLNADLNASGTSGGGTVRIGGDYQGADTVFNASRTYVSQDSTITADAGASGHGGRAIVWADGTTQFLGTISAQGGTTAGDGGFVEVSGAQSLGFDGQVNVGATQGQLGTLLLDPTNITISNAADDAGVGTALPDILAAELPGNININAATLQSQVGNVVLEATDNITIATGISLNFVLGGSIAFTADTNNDGVGAFAMDPTQTISARGDGITNGRDITIRAAQVTVGNIDTGINVIGSTTNGGRVQITSTNGEITTGSITTEIGNGLGNAGNVTLNATAGNITNASVNAYAINGTGGDVTFTTTAGNITTGSIFTASNTVVANSRPGNINLEVIGAGNITTGLLQAYAYNSGPGGEIAVTAGSGDIAINGIAAYSRIGVDGNVTLIAQGAPNSITVNGGINLRNTTAVSGSDVPGGGNITLNANEINLLGGANSLQGTGQLLLQSATADTAIALGSLTDSAATTLDLLASDLATFEDGFSAIVIGRANSTGAVSVDGSGGLTFSDPLTLRSPGAGGSVTVNNAISLTPNDNLTLLAGGPIRVNQALTTSNGAINLTATPTTTGVPGIVLFGNLTSGGGNITLNGSSLDNNFGIYLDTPNTINSGGGAISLQASAPIFGMQLQGTLLSGGGAIDLVSQSGELFLSGTVESAGGAINLTSFGAPGTTVGLTFSQGATLNPGAGGTSTLTSDNNWIFFPLNGTGTLVLRPLAPSLDITLGGNGNAQTTFLNDAELGLIGSGFGSVTLGRPDSTGAVQLVSIPNLAASTTIAGGSTLTGPNQATTWTLAGANSGTVRSATGTVSFQNFEGLIGDANNDEFVFESLGIFGGTIVGNGGTDTLNYSRITTPITLNLSDLTGFENLVGAAATTLVGPDTDNTWTLTGANAGSINNILTFSGVQALQGGNANDTFVVNNGVTFGGTVAGGAGFDTYDFSAYTTDLTVNLGTLGAQGIESIIGGQATNTLVGADTASTWSLTGVDSGTVNDTAFSRFQNLQGGSGDDSMLVGDGGQMTGRILGGGGSDRLIGGGAARTAPNNWVITGQNTGTLNGNNFGDFELLTGAAGEDQFQFTTDETFEGGIEGLTGPLQLSGNSVRLAGDITAQGEVVINADDTIRVGSIDTRIRDEETGSLLEPGQNITLTARNGSVRTGDLNASGTQGGTVTVNARTAITTGAINTSGSLGNGGNVTLDPIRDIQVDSINAEGGSNGIGGTVDITAGRFFRATDSFINRNGERASISTAGGLGGGAITIRHGGNGRIPFYIGDNVGDNGSRAAITNGIDTFASGEFFFNSVTRGTAQILTNNPPDNQEPVLPSCEANCDESEPSSPPQPTSGVLDIPTVSDTRAMLLDLAEQTGIPPALIYVSFISPGIPLPNDFAEREAIASQQVTNYLQRDHAIPSPLLTVQPQDNDELELMLVLPRGDIIRRRVPGVTRGMVIAAKQQLTREITAPNRFRSNRYLAPAQQLHQWLIAPLEADLEAEDIGNLAFILDTGLRSLPLSVLYDGDQFLIERYSIGLMPSVTLTDTRYHDIRNVPVLAMGASEFEALQPLPAVPAELATVTGVVPNSVAFLNRSFTEANLLESRYERPFSIVHLATHAEFRPGEMQNSYIQFSDRRLPLNDLRQLRLNEPPVELLVLSACKTALGDNQAELGFGGLAVQTGVRSVLASLWYVSDTGTLSFMSEFYQQLQQAPTRSEALRDTQLAMLRGETRIQSDQLVTSMGAIPLPPELQGFSSIDLTHPYFWASFTMIGSPW